MNVLNLHLWSNLRTLMIFTNYVVGYSEEMFGDYLQVYSNRIIANRIRMRAYDVNNGGRRKRTRRANWIQSKVE